MQFASMNLGIIDSIISFFVTLLTNVVLFILNIVKWLLSNVLFNIGKIIMEIADVIQSMFRKFAGLEPTWFSGEEREGDILLSLLSASSVQRVFLALTLVAIALILIFSIIQMIRSEYTTEGSGNTKTKIIGNALKGFVMFIVVPFSVFLGIYASNFILQALDNATSGGNKSNFSSTIFISSMYNANRFRTGSFSLLTNLSSKGTHVSGAWSSIISSNGTSGHVQLTTEARAELKNPTNKTWADYANYVGPNASYIRGTDQGDEAGIALLDFIYLACQDMGTPLSLKGSDLTEDAETVALAVDSLFRNNARIQNNTKVILFNLDFTGDASSSFSSMGVGDSFIFPPAYTTSGNERQDESENAAYAYSISPLFSEIVSCFYSIPNCNFIILFGGGLFAIYCLLMAIFGLIMRLIKGTLYYMICPPLIGMYPIDNGSAFQSWRKKFIGMVLAAYGTVVALNLMFIILPLINSIQIFDPVFHANYQSGMLAGPAANYFVQLLITIVTLFFFKDAPKMVGDFIGADDAMGEGKGMAKQVGGAIANTVMAGKNIVGGIKNRVQSKALSKQYEEAQQKADAEDDPAAKAALQAQADSIKQQAQMHSKKADKYGSSLRAQASKAVSTVTGGLYQAKDANTYTERRNAKIERIGNKVSLAEATDDAVQKLQQQATDADNAGDTATADALRAKASKLTSTRTYKRANRTRDMASFRTFGAAGQAMENVKLARSEAQSKDKDKTKSIEAKIQSTVNVDFGTATQVATDRMDNQKRAEQNTRASQLSKYFQEYDNDMGRMQSLLATGSVDDILDHVTKTDDGEIHQLLDKIASSTNAKEKEQLVARLQNSISDLSKLMSSAAKDSAQQLEIQEKLANILRDPNISKYIKV